MVFEIKLEKKMKDMKDNLIYGPIKKAKDTQ